MDAATPFNSEQHRHRYTIRRKGVTGRGTKTCQSCTTKEAPVMKCNKKASSCTTWKKCFSLRVVQHGDGSHRRAGDSSSLEVFKISLDKALNNLL